MRSFSGSFRKYAFQQNECRSTNLVFHLLLFMKKKQAGVVASMGFYAVYNNVSRLVEDHERAKRLAVKLEQAGFRIARNGRVDTNMFYFRLPLASPWVQKKEYFAQTLSAEYSVKLVGGYSRGKEYFRVVTHMDLDDKDIDQAAESIIELAFKNV
jgi:threonine aldolase